MIRPSLHEGVIVGIRSTFLAAVLRLVGCTAQPEEWSDLPDDVFAPAYKKVEAVLKKARADAIENEKRRKQAPTLVQPSPVPLVPFADDEAPPAPPAAPTRKED